MGTRYKAGMAGASPFIIFPLGPPLVVLGYHFVLGKFKSWFEEVLTLFPTFPLLCRWWSCLRSLGRLSSPRGESLTLGIMFSFSFANCILSPVGLRLKEGARSRSRLRMLRYPCLGW